MSADVLAVRGWAVDGGDFPYQAVLAAYRRWGKALVPDKLLDALCEARRARPANCCPFWTSCWTSATASTTTAPTWRCRCSPPTSATVICSPCCWSRT